MNKGFDKTPSFFNDEETFSKYLAKTSYYIGLQDNVKKLVELAKPKKVLELGAATGATTIMLAETFPNVEFVGIDMRDDVVAIASNNAVKAGLSNVKFATNNMVDVATDRVDSDFVYLLYSFHHIVDPLSNKINFLKNMYQNMKSGAYLCIAETFVSDKLDGLDSSKEIVDIWNVRKDEGFASTYWKSLEGLDKDSIGRAEAIAEFCAKNEYLAGELVAKRDEEYLIQPKWLIDEATKIGFEVIINQPINIIEDRIILLRKK